EAGGDPLQLDAPRLPEDYQIPAFHPFASENEAIRWDFFVRHYTHDQQQMRDVKFIRDRDGVLYPRAGTLGGCTAHNALILVYPDNDDWEYIARLTRDASWNPANMRKLFERMEDCRHRPVYRRLRNLFGVNLTGHGFGGWLTTERPICMEALRDDDLMDVIRGSAKKAIRGEQHPLKRLLWMVQSQADPNDWRLVKSHSYGVRYTPVSTRDGVRIGSRERILAVSNKHPDKLCLELNALVTRVLFNDDNRAVGVAYLKGERLYRAQANPSTVAGEPREVFASREVILCGGAFNTPQLLMLSGVGPRQELERHGIQVRVELPGVGTNLQDRYEVSVVNRMKDDWEVLTGARFGKGDPQYQKWASAGKGVYTTNGGVLTVVKKSQPWRKVPDLFLLGLVGRFEGYFPKYSELIARHHDYLSWVVLKAHTVNSAGTVTLRSKDPRDAPQIDFRYFEEGNDNASADLESVVEGVKFVRKMTADLKKRRLILEETLPGEGCQTDEQLRDFVRNNAWGHHASCTCPIGPREAGGVLSSDFRVHGTQGLRVADASVFPRIPGFFIVCAVYMIGEKAADVILAELK
ncbi:MAG TPA: GMC oxidoreductase, partial [Candidatus Binatia bacterium]|nr:GMC oxidoreductase [Candidatus Binatia bacterium]